MFLPRRKNHLLPSMFRLPAWCRALNSHWVFGVVPRENIYVGQGGQPDACCMISTSNGSCLQIHSRNLIKPDSCSSEIGDHGSRYRLQLHHIDRPVIIETNDPEIDHTVTTATEGSCSFTVFCCAFAGLPYTNAYRSRQAPVAAWFSERDYWAEERIVVSE